MKLILRNQHYNHIANQNKAINEKAHKGWINSHTPEQIRVANLARTSLKRKVAAGAPGIRKGMKGLSKIKDERQPKRPASAYIIFATERRASGDFKNISLPETAKLITQEWKALGPAETKVSDHGKFDQKFTHANYPRNTRTSRKQTKHDTYASFKLLTVTQPQQLAPPK